MIFDRATLARQIETWMLTEPRWITAQEIADRFAVAKRELRARGEKPGICDEYAVSSQDGYKHVRHMSVEEFRLAAHGLIRHYVAEARKVKRWRAARHHPLTGRPAALEEKCTGQRVFPL